jgi:hypothetical protein
MQLQVILKKIFAEKEGMAGLTAAVPEKSA